MKRFLFAAAMAAATAPAFAADVGVSISVGEPGFYGQINIGNVPPPVLIYPQPVIIQPVPVGVVRQPIYLHVPPGHEKHWSKHCAQYNACGRRVYFVRDEWYNNEYVPHYQNAHDNDHGHGHGHDKHGDHDEGHGHHND